MAGTFSESWYRIARLRAALRPTVKCRKQYYRGTPWYFLHDPYNKSFYRLNPAYYRFISRLRFDRTIEEVWLDALKDDPETGPGQQDVLSLLIELHSENLIYFNESPDSGHLFLRGDEKKSKETMQQWMNILFMRIPLWNPDRWLTQLLPLWRLLYSKTGLLIGAVLLALGIKTGIEHAAELTAQAGQVLAPGNFLLLWVGVAIIKLFHEIGHGAICKRFGGTVNTVGVMLLLFVPLPYIDATSSWELRDKWQRILISAGGMLMEFFIGACACMVWAYAPPGLIRSITYNMMLTATVSTLLFNSNPLLKYDGYYILADLIEIPNLFQKSREQVLRWCEKHLFGRRDVELPAQSWSEAAWLCGYGCASMVYRVVLLVGILLFIADSYAALGMALAIFMGAAWVIKPLWHFAGYLFTSPQLQLVRRRAVAVSMAAISLPLLLVFGYPWPTQAVFPGVVESTVHSEVLAETAGQVAEMLVQPGSMVAQGQALIRLTNPVLALDRRKVEAQLEQIAVLEQGALLDGGGDRLPLAKRKEASERLLDDIATSEKQLLICAAQSGLWIFSTPREVQGQWVAKGYQFGEILNLERMRFSAVVSQEEASSLFAQQLKGLAVRLSGQGERSLAVGDHNLIPHAHENLPNQALSWMAGGTVTTDSNGRDVLRAAEPFYLLHADLQAAPGLLAGQTGQLRVQLAPQSMAERGYRAVRQFLQKRYLL
ncbi:MAG: biotin/lipoyl-binding protein [Chlorobium sp.]|jgi:putative peptide zinc metalloprotease protein|nr:biotin/lipoyl-binding protein [Chlorobium sp.]